MAEQTAIAARLENKGYRTVEVAQTLSLFEQTLAIFEEHYQAILNEIANPDETQHWRPPHHGIRRLYPP